MQYSDGASFHPNGKKTRIITIEKPGQPAELATYRIDGTRLTVYPIEIIREISTPKALHNNRKA